MSLPLIHLGLSRLLAVALNKVKSAPDTALKPHEKAKALTSAFTFLFLATGYFLLHQGCSPALDRARNQPEKTADSSSHPNAQNPSAPIAQNGVVDAVSVPEIARQVTVRIITNPGSGSGVIIGRRGQVYTVLTCDHVVANRSDNNYTILTADGRTHPAQWLRSIKLGDTDLALVQFSSTQSYQVVKLGDSNALKTGDEVYAAGFPNWYWKSANAIEDTRNWGLRAYRFTTGQIGMVAERSLPRGYQLGYTNEIEQGMSGGPVLDKYGRLIAINGRLKFPPQGIEVYTFADGTKPSQTLFQQMESLSWGIPITTFEQMMRQP